MGAGKIALLRAFNAPECLINASQITFHVVTKSKSSMLLPWVLKRGN